FQAEDGIRDLIVTGVQTCALPIWPGSILVLAGACVMLLGASSSSGPVDPGVRSGTAGAGGQIAGMTTDQLNQFTGYKNVFIEVRSEERRVGKECRVRCGGDTVKKR